MFILPSDHSWWDKYHYTEELLHDCMELVVLNYFTCNVCHFFPDRPGSCSPDAEVVCSLSPDGSNITVSLHNATAGHCVVGYMFQLSHENMTVSVEDGLTVFSINSFYGTVQLNQKVYTMDSEGQFGNIPCSFGIISKLLFVTTFVIYRLYSINFSPRPSLHVHVQYIMYGNTLDWKILLREIFPFLIFTCLIFSTWQNVENF